MHQFKNILIITGCEGDTTRYRCYHKQEQLARLGVNSVVHYFGERAMSDKLDIFDAVILHRVPIDDYSEELIRNAKALGRRVIFDTDDMVFDPGLLQWVRALDKMSKDEVDLYADGVRRYRATLALCDFVITSTDFLARHVRRIGKPTIVVRNALSQELILRSEKARNKERPKRDKVVLGYFSGTRTHDSDFQVATQAILNILEEFPFVELLLVGPLEADHRFGAYGKRVRRLGLVPWQQLPGLIADVDINLAPLEEGNPFCESKSELKYMEAGIVGVPTVASATDSFAFAIKNGLNGFLASGDKEWEERLKPLVRDPNLRASIGENALQHVLANYTPDIGGGELTEALRIAQEWTGPSQSMSARQHGRPLSIGWVLGEPIKGSGGYNSIFQMVQQLASVGHNNHLYVQPENELWGAGPGEVAKFLHNNFFDVEAEVHVGHEFQDADVLIATHWTTAYAVNRSPSRAKKAYYIQDFEPWFFSAGAEFLAAELTYSFPLLGLTLGPWLAKFLRQTYGARTQHFDFAYDRSVYFPDSKGSSSSKPQIAFYARPSTPRRATSLGLAALEIVHQAAPDVKIVLFGATDLNRQEIAFPFFDAGIQSPKRLAEIYRSSTVGLCLSCTNPSFIPFEMLACKCPVVELRSQRVEELLVHGTNALLAEPTPQSLANAVLTLLDNDGLRASIARNGYEMVKDWSWENSARQVEKALLAEVRGESLSQTSSIVVGDPPEDDLLLYHRSMDVAQLNDSSIKDSISGNISVGQSFICYEDGLYRIDLKVAKDEGNVQGRVVFRLKENVHSLDSLVKLETTPKAASDSGWLPFRFNPIADSRLKAYYLCVEMPQASSQQGIALHYSTETFPDGSMFESQIPRGGSLTFRTFVMSKKARLITTGEFSENNVLALVERRREELALAQTRLAQSQIENNILIRCMAGHVPSTAKGRDEISISQRGGRTNHRHDRKNHSPRPGSHGAPSRRRFVRGSGGSLISKSVSALRYEGLTGLRREIRSYSRWRLSRLNGQRARYTVSADAGRLKKSWLLLRHAGPSGLAKEVRNYVLWRLSR